MFETDRSKFLESYKDEKKLKDWGKDAIRNVVANPSDEQDLNNQITNYNLMTRKQKREADWKSEELLGVNNIDNFEDKQSDYLKADISDDDLIEYDGDDISPYIEAVEPAPITFGSISYTTTAIDSAQDYANDAMRIIIIPTNDLDMLEKQWTDFKSMIRKHQRESDWKALELFGVDNETHYNYLKNKLVKKDIEDIDIAADKTDDSIVSSESYIEKKCRFISNLNPVQDAIYIAEVCMELSNIKNKTLYEDVLVSNTIDKSINKFNACISDSFSAYIPSTDLPFYTPEEMISFGVFEESNNFYKVKSDMPKFNNDNTSKEWFNKYQLMFNGFPTDDTKQLQLEWVSKLRELFSDLEYIKKYWSPKDINARKQSILELGWNPDIDFNETNRVLAYERVSNIIKENAGSTTFIDIRDQFVNESISTSQSEFMDLPKIDNPKNILHPIYIVLVEGTSAFSNAIKKYTHGPFSHAAISFDAKLNRMYSYNLTTDNINAKLGGLSIEDVNNYPKDKRLGVFTIFVKEKELKKIRKMVDTFINNRDKTSYSITNVLALLFKLPLHRDWKMICSQFVDRLLKVANIDITNKDSAFVTPNDFAKLRTKNKKIYEIYNGLVSKYNVNKIDRMMDRLIIKAVYIKEYFNKCSKNSLVNIVTEDACFLNEKCNCLYDNMLSNLVLQPVVETKEFPIQFDDDGNLLIKNISSIDFAAEFSKSHKLLVQYEKHHNDSGMKYELSKLWFINNILEKRLRSNIYRNNKKSYTNTRALILNDFKKYLDAVQMIDGDFNFTNYYNNTPFSDATIMVKKSTLNGTIALVKSILG